VQDLISTHSLRDKLQNLLQVQIPDLVVNGDLNNRLSGNLNISIPRIPNSVPQTSEFGGASQL